ncbi:hypothetical protein [Nocardia goodfellowii]|uniref:Uncharacterized protein n=1 Tax=Nocardia goodfellowii TaxID=882446 RepID=A0ABS4QLA1_9NOCA|nr:hypothetical protein [Nocardia goodfellowii]MBP2192486.1 hypothetical protein [Nocardia goodfellowii]
MAKSNTGPVSYSAKLQLTVDGEVVTDHGELTERQYLWLFAKRPGMYIGRTTLRGVTSFLDGYHYAAHRYGGAGLSGFREWLMSNHQVGVNLIWWAQIEQIALPSWDLLTDLTPEQEAHILEVLFDLLDRFLIERDNETSSIEFVRVQD